MSPADAWLETIADSNPSGLEATIRPETLTMPPGETGSEPRSIVPPGTQELAEAFRMGEVLGRGGMGLVREALQSSLSRQVAVKTVRETVRDDEHQRHLVREAVVTGFLEHPNIVPVYQICQEVDGSPAIVMRKLEGLEWAKLIHSADNVRERFGKEDLLEWNLRILLEVINAVRYAHSRGVLHRDLKPSNVMIGDYGEVFVVDWGIAVSVGAELPGLLKASEADQLAGTPVYMAPEMLEPTASPADERTDVYLLGAMLYEIMAGRAPHKGANTREVLELVRRSQPVFDDAMPTELVAICQRSLRRDPEARFQTAEELGRAIEGFLGHRHSHLLQERAANLLARLEILLEDVVGATDRAGFDARRRQVYGVFSPCRFAFQEALRVWDGNAQAAEGLERCLAHMVRFELSAGEPGAAALLAEEMEVIEPCLAAELAEAAATRRAEDEEARQLRQKADRHEGSGARRATFASIGLGWALGPAMLALFLEKTSYLSQTLVHLGFLGLWLGIGQVGRSWVRATSVNRRLYRLVLGGVLLALVFNVGAYIMGMPPELSQVVHLFVFLAVGVPMILTVEWRAWPTVVAYAAGFWYSASRPDMALWAMAASNAVLAANAFLIWQESVDIARRRSGEP